MGLCLFVHDGLLARKSEAGIQLIVIEHHHTVLIGVSYSETYSLAMAKRNLGHNRATQRVYPTHVTVLFSNLPSLELLT